MKCLALLAMLLLPLSAAGGMFDVDPAAAAAAKLDIATTRSLVFGRFVAGAGGRVTVAPNGTRSRTGAVLLLPSSASSAGFLFSDYSPSSKNRVLIITLPGNSSVVLRSGANSMAVTTFTSDRGVTAVLQNGSLTMALGASLTVGANQPRGNYSGVIPLTVEYQ